MNYQTSGFLYLCFSLCRSFAQFPSELGIETSSLRTAICVAGNRLQLEQSISETTEDEATVSEEELEFKPSKEQIGGMLLNTLFIILPLFPGLNNILLPVSVTISVREQFQYTNIYMT